MDKFKLNENAILWMNQVYESVRGVHNWEPVEVSKDDLDAVKVSVDNAWYGGGLHEKVTMDFNYEKYNSCREIAAEEKKRLNQLKDFFRIVLENIHQLVPIEEEFVKNGETWESNKKVEEDGKAYETYEYRVSKLFQGLRRNTTMLEETASVFKSLGDKGVKYNEAQKILDLMNSSSDVDNLTIRVQTAQRGAVVNVIDSCPILVRPEKKTRLKELPEEIVQNITQLMAKVLLSKELLVKYEEVFDILINVNNPGLFKVADRPELGQKISDFKSSPRNMIAVILNKYQDLDGTIGSLNDAFLAIKKDQTDSKKYTRAMNLLVEGLDNIAKDARQLSEERLDKQLAKDRSLKTFLRFLKDHQPDSMKLYANAKGFGKEQFLRLAADKQILPGDMIGFYRKKLGLQFAHAGIYAPVNDNQRYVVHVQAQGGSFRGVMKQSEVKCEELKNVIGQDDKVFYIRECENSMAQADILSSSSRHGPVNLSKDSQRTVGLAVTSLIWRWRRKRTLNWGVLLAKIAFELKPANGFE